MTKPARHESPFWHRKTRGKTRLIYFANSTGVGKSIYNFAHFFNASESQSKARNL